MAHFLNQHDRIPPAPDNGQFAAILGSIDASLKSLLDVATGNVKPADQTPVTDVALVAVEAAEVVDPALAVPVAAAEAVEQMNLF